MLNEHNVTAATNTASQEKPVALITGANRSIGLQVAKELVANGYAVLVGSRNYDSGAEAAAGIGADAHAIQIDVTDQESIEKAAARVRTEFGRLDLLVNNAALSHDGGQGRTMQEVLAVGSATTASVAEMRRVWETNVFGALAVTQAFLPLLKEAPKARIVNVTSGLGSLTLNSDPTFPYRGAFGVIYGASKTALNAITLSLAIDLKDTNITVEAASPGFTATALNNFEGTDSIEVGSQNVVRAALGQNGEALFTGPEGEYPW